ncbi:GGDEF domain-containing protein [Blastococcus sp. KM273128]|uniref:GGDEF domain-containing protein n=1 Tax=Blastococcus sp. KM273128 TaxID=2570314 RepID=UPI001F2B62B5|nr:GGDEF domain-containing protein [Blastococcus sp. KM273128]MCF6743971.1 GGDEF domain-containing protein [Blastococcus sp. KM273128]
MSRSRAPEVATLRVMAQTLAIFYGFGGVAGLLVTAGAGPGPHRPVLLGLALSALAGAAVVARWGARWPRPAFDVVVGSATVLVSVGILVSPDPATALAAAALITFVVVDAHLFFSGRRAWLQLAFAVGAVTAALQASGEVPPATALALDAVLVGLGVVIRRLVIRASGASRDPLTGLRNRRGFDEALDELLSEAARTREPLSAALLDVDHFKQVNDTYGHEAGDRVLRRVADVWRAELPAGSVLARHGGDEFSLLLPGMRGVDALAVVRRICALHPDVPLSCGVTQHAPGDSASQLMRGADRALYDAKLLGRGRTELFDGPAGRPTGVRPRG